MDCRQSLLVVSIDLEPRTNTTSLQHQREVRSAGSDLMRLFNKYQIPATWAVAAPGQDPKTDPILASNVSHEIAIQGDAVWATEKVNRASFAGHLSESVARAADRGVMVHSLVGLNVKGSHTDLLVKNAITTLRSARPGSHRSVRWIEPHQVRFGVWDLPESYRFPGPKTWLSEITKMGLQRGVKTASARKRPLHVVVDAEKVASSKASCLKTLEGVLECAAQYRHSNQLRTETLTDSVELITTRPAVSSARSILRAA
ncbi:hypothetical protein ACFL2H_09360 [Planctomycetota bacterium]